MGQLIDFTEPRTLVVHSPGRVNLVGDHTDYSNGVALPMAVNLGITARFTPAAGPGLEVVSSAFPERFRMLPNGTIPGSDVPIWVRYVSAVTLCAPQLRIPDGLLVLSSDLPIGAGLSSSAALCIAVAILLGGDWGAMELARREQAAEKLVGVDVGLLDPIVIAAAEANHALFIDFATLEWSAVPMPPELETVVIHSGVARSLLQSPYGRRRRECEEAARLVGPLPDASDDDVSSIADPALRRRARHVVAECRRVREMVHALEAGNLQTAGKLLLQSHQSLRDEFEVSVPEVNALVDILTIHPGVYGARMTGGGFGGCVVAFTEPGAIDLNRWPGRAWRVNASDGALRQRQRITRE